jgi:yeast amino acid transporter
VFAAPLLGKPKGVKLFSSRAFDNFRSGPTGDVAPALGEHGRVFDAKAAAYNTAHTPLVRRLKGRHLLLVSQGLGFDCNQMVGKLVVCIFRDVSLARKIEESQVL